MEECIEVELVYSWAPCEDGYNIKSNDKRRE
jgi:hypothetical protein